MAAVPDPPTQVGQSIPAHTPHAVSVSLPTWQANVGYEEGDPQVTSKMECGYPRFFIHPYIQKLVGRIVAKYGQANESGMLFPTRKIAEKCRAFLQRYYTEGNEEERKFRIVELEFGPEGNMPLVHVFVVLFPTDAFRVAKQYWQHCGDILSSRQAEYCLRLLDKKAEAEAEQAEALKPKRGNQRYGRPGRPLAANAGGESCEAEHLSYVEERYGRNLPVQYADHAKVALRRRIAGIITEKEDEQALQLEDVKMATEADLETQRQMQGERNMKGLSEDDVYLYPCGMSAIFHAHQLALAIGDASRKSVCFGFPYTDTLKILQKFGAGCHFYGRGEDKDIDDLEALLASGERILSLFCELPSNPLLKSPDLRRLRRLADQYDFLLVVDETIGNFYNIGVLEHADMVVSSLTKIFSGDSNVMGGSMVLNPNRKHYRELKEALKDDFEDVMWCEDALFLERNSRSFKARSKIINENAEALCDYLVAHQQVKEVYYPKFICRHHYDAVKTPNGGYGGLFSVTFKSEKAAQAFYDNLHCAKGPSLGTNFTLASPYTILAHYTELDWAEEYGVSRFLVRVSVGLEDKQHLLSMFGKALDAIDA